MTTTIIHIPDLHLQENWQEEQGVVLREFFADLKLQIRDSRATYVVFTGDILQEGSKAQGYQYFNTAVNARLHELGISSDKLIVIPGNHDIDREYTEKHFSTLKGLQQRATEETEFNKNIYGDQCNLLKEKFLPFLEWQKSISNWPLTEDSFCGRGFDLTTDIGIYCLNTALYSFGGLKDEQQNTVSDYKELPVETRRLHTWLENSSHSFRILVMHHPTEWLTDWAGEAINTLCYRHFNLVLTGHIHKKDAFYIHDGVDSYVLCSSPQLFSRKSDLLGYSILNIGEGFCDLSIHYRQWAHDRFVAGTSFSKNDTGKLRLDLSDADRADSVSEKYTTSYKHILKRLENDLQKCLKCYTSLPAVWVLPNIADKSEFYSDDETAVINPASNLHSPFRNCIVIAPRQFGLSSLGRYLSLAAWRSTLNQYAMYIDSS